MAEGGSAKPPDFNAGLPETAMLTPILAVRGDAGRIASASADTPTKASNGPGGMMPAAAQTSKASRSQSWSASARFCLALSEVLTIRREHGNGVRRTNRQC